MLSRLVGFVAVALTAALVHAAPVPPIIDLAGVQAARERGAIFWDVRPTEAYRKGHLPGAISIGDAGTVLRDPDTEDFLPTAKIQKLFAAAGLDPSREIVVYAERGSPTAYFGRFALRYFGAVSVSVFHDGIDGWSEAGLPLEKKTSHRPAVKLKLVPQPQLIIETDELLAKLKSGKLQLIDARSPAEYTGEVVRASQGGHIPGAVNIPYTTNWADAAAFAQLQQARSVPEKLKALYARFDPEQEIITYCQSGMRAAVTASVLEALGFRHVRVYDTSWLGYADRPDAPIATVAP
jgi:thiosulfate/3-mercaptopyruvate sulfurtransferase